MALVIFCSIIISYLIGSVPTSIWLGKLRFNIDIRDYGSGNAGATNTFRVLGKKAGLFVMTVDITKGFFATYLPLYYSNFGIHVTENQIVLLQVIMGFVAVLGHVFPVYEKFKGGKGVASLLGMVFAINIYAASGCLAIFLVVLFISKYVSLGSIIASLAFPILLSLPAVIHGEPNRILIVFGCVVFILVAITHQKNIIRLVNGEENKARIKIKRTN